MDAGCRLQALPETPNSEIGQVWTPQSAIVTIRDYEDHIGVLICFHYTTITGWAGSS